MGRVIDFMTGPMPWYQAVLLIAGLSLLLVLVLSGGMLLLYHRFPAVRQRAARIDSIAEVWRSALFWTVGLALIDVGLYKTGHLPNPVGAFTSLPLTFVFFLSMGLWVRRVQQKRGQL